MSMNYWNSRQHNAIIYLSNRSNVDFSFSILLLLQCLLTRFYHPIGMENAMERQTYVWSGLTISGMKNFLNGKYQFGKMKCTQWT